MARAATLEEVRSTAGEKALAAVLAVFVFVGLLWSYDQLELRPDLMGAAAASAADASAIRRHAAAEARLAGAAATEQRTLTQLELARETYRTALDADAPAEPLRRRYRAAEERFAAARVERSAAAAAEARLRPPATAAHERAGDAADEARRSAELATVGLRLLLVLLAVGTGAAAVVRLRGSRYEAVAVGALAAGGAIALVLGVDYVTDYVDWRNGGPVVLSLAGAGLTLTAFWALQRHLRRRIPLRRARKGECSFCGYPLRGTAHCEGCGRSAVGSCSACGDSRRVGAPHCGSCGASAGRVPSAG